MEKIRDSCGFRCGIDVGAVGSRGGLLLVWKDNYDVTLRSFSQSHIDVSVRDDYDDHSWRLTGFYGNLIENLKKKS